MTNGIIIAGFATCGKSYLGQKYHNVIDLESSNYKHINYDIVLVQLKPEHLDYFDKNNIKYSIAYPNINDWDIVEKRCVDRGNNDNFIKRLNEVFIPYYEDCLKRDYEKMYIINKNESLESILIKNNIKLEDGESDEK